MDRKLVGEGDPDLPPMEFHFTVWSSYCCCRVHWGNDEKNRGTDYGLSNAVRFFSSTSLLDHSPPRLSSFILLDLTPEGFNS